MKTIFSARERASTWRTLWIHLAEGEKELGINISDEAIEQMKARAIMTDEDFKIASEEEKRYIFLLENCCCSFANGTS
jgi:adenylosuccinate lyase